MDIRPIRAHEWRELRAIRLRATTESPGSFWRTRAEIESWPDETWTRLARRGATGDDMLYVVADDGGAWAGIAGGLEPEPGDDPASRSLGEMWVDPARRGAGLGRALAEQIVTWARDRGVPELVLWVGEAFDGPRALYRSLGFHESGEREPFLVDPNTAAVRMVLDLRGPTA